MISKARIQLLFDQYMEETASAEETQEFFLLVNDPVNEVFLHHLMDEYLTSHEFTGGLDDSQKRNILNHVFSAEDHLDSSVNLSRRIYPLYRKLMTAAVVLLTLSIGIYLVSKRVDSGKIYKGELSPGGNKATLTLADGTKLSLTDAVNGKLAEQSGISIRKTADGKLLYEVKDPGYHHNNRRKAELSSEFNTITTPPGGQYQVVLSDGSHVWLNSASSLKYPISFASSGRKVELTGEAYFEIAKVSNRKGRLPFIVSGKKQDVEVLGTHFNINGYDTDEFTITTLLEGSVKISKAAVFERIISPGQQARVNQNIKVAEVDTTVAVAWKNGLFKFENAGISTVMDQFSRWYDVDVEYKGKIPANKFNGEIYRNMNASKALRILGFANINFRVEAPENNHGRKKIVIIQN
ncbi:FecR family protein [Pedobacter cryoconitis]|uniref:FecR family protein n=1 Tax=Pedobacter cryoconitis TaxID=188932 RepID=A0A7X0MJN4_9SPHI|nr:FecR family protein [Pedobacter cryoconitis]MBB6501181.1 hypothetical protein [Pedobacter cryoconitis]